jgi:hypothetical protein
MDNEIIKECGLVNKKTGMEYNATECYLIVMK